MRCLDARVFRFSVAKRVNVVTEKTNDSECLVFGGKPKKTSQMYNSKNMFVYKLTKLILLLIFFSKKHLLQMCVCVCVCVCLYFLCIFAAKSSPFMGSHPRVGPRCSEGSQVPFGKFRDQKKAWETLVALPMTDPWDCYIYLHEWLRFMVNVGKYTIHGSYD